MGAQAGIWLPLVEANAGFDSVGFAQSGVPLDKDLHLWLAANFVISLLQQEC
jgi:hypothetical protein